MPRRFRHSPPDAGFTLLEMCVVLMLVIMLILMAIPSLRGVLEGNQSQNSFTSFDEMVQDAHSRAIAEHRAYVLMWSPKKVILRPDSPMNDAEAAGLRAIEITKDDVLNLFLPASLAERKGKITAAIWTFWPVGVCEPATIQYKGKRGHWKATYNPFTVQAETNYD